jgi:hypothetical protein
VGFEEGQNILVENVHGSDRQLGRVESVDFH